MRAEIKSKFMLFLIDRLWSDPNVDPTGAFTQIGAIAEALTVESFRVGSAHEGRAAAVQDAPPAAPALSKDELDRDGQVLAALIQLTPTGGLGPRRSTWAAACVHFHKIGRRAFDTSRARLLGTGKVTQVGKRFLAVANTDTP